MVEVKMRYWRALLLVSLAAAGTYACASTTQVSSSPSNSVCPTVSPGPPAVCPEGCVWNGKECRESRSIIMPDANDGGTDASEQSIIMPDSKDKDSGTGSAL
jgi:hypothetical protein